MDVLFGSLLQLAGAVTLLWSVHVNSASKPDRRIPLLLGNPTRGSRKAYSLQVLGNLFNLGGMYLWIQIMGAPGVLMLLVSFVPWLLAGMLHNRRIAQASLVA
ncbi:hypothetical protein ACHABX_05470 [Nesterenkonia halotolerans]|uniref:hypothetical protein n=1 Tax=Nesterenkonia halotolerans TaxID=225325 RepID=UPI003EE570FC